MKKNAHLPRLTTGLLGLGLLLAGNCFAQTPEAAAPVPSAQEIVNALSAKPRTRGFKVVETPVQGGAPAAAPASEPARVQSAPAAPAVAAPAAVRPPSSPQAQVAPPVAAPVAQESPAEPASIDLAIQFAFNSSEILPASKVLLANLAQALNTPNLAGMQFMIEGHTDSKGNAYVNLKLSQQRAEQVRRLLVSQGVALERLSAVGRGASVPLNPAKPEAPENRRVRILTREK